LPQAIRAMHGRRGPLLKVSNGHFLSEQIPQVRTHPFSKGPLVLPVLCRSSSLSFDKVWSVRPQLLIPLLGFCPFGIPDQLGSLSFLPPRARNAVPRLDSPYEEYTNIIPPQKTIDFQFCHQSRRAKVCNFWPQLLHSNSSN